MFVVLFEVKGEVNLYYAARQTNGSALLYECIFVIQDQGLGPYFSKSVSAYSLSLSCHFLLPKTLNDKRNE
jgi:hypothetical protein